MADYRFKNANPLKAGNYWQNYVKQMPLMREMPQSVNRKLNNLHKALGMVVTQTKKGVNIKFRK